MVRSLLLGACSLALVGCGTSKTAFMNSPVGLSQADNLQVQRPAYPNTHAAMWDHDDRLHASVTVDYISGMNQRSYFLASANQRVYRPMLEWSLARAGLLAPTSTAARYALQVEFQELDTERFGAGLAGKSVANYRLVHRATGQTVYERTINSNFLSHYRSLNEEDASKAYNISEPPFLATQAAFATFAIGDGVIVETINNVRDLRHFFDGPIEEASQATWNEAYQAYLWGTYLSALAGPLVVAVEQIDPTNYIAFADKYGDGPSAAPAGAVKGALSTSGIGSRDGRERAAQANSQMLAQSLTKFVIDLAIKEDVQFTLVLPCTDSEEVADMRRQVVLSGHRYRTDNCLAYQKDRPQDGLGFNNW